MKKITAALIFLSAFALKGFVFADRNVTLEVDSVFTAQEQLQNSYINSEYGWTNQLEFDAHLIVSPAMNLGSSDLQPDALLDVFITRQTSTNSFIIALREAFVDMLFYSSLSVKAGFIRLDYGALNSWYNPLNIVELLNLENLYSQIMIGNARQGYEGLPTAQAVYSLPEFIPEFKLSLEQDMISASLSNLQENYFISKIEGIYGNLDVTALAGYTGNSGFMPVFGGSLSLRLPYNIMFFGEAVYKTQSFRWIVTNGILVTNRSGNFLDATAKLSYAFQEPLFNNTVGLSAEYFHYGEGLTPGQYGDGYSFINNSGSAGSYAPGFFRMDRDFEDYMYFTLSYNLVVPKVAFTYLLDDELESGYLQHTFSIAKSYDTVTLSANFVYNQVSDSSYSMVFYDQDFAVYLEILMAF